MENNNELVVYGENGQIIECKFQRVDFNNPPTVISYCDDVIESLANILDSTSKLVIETPQEIMDTKTIDRIALFNEGVDESLEEQANPGLATRTKRSLNSMFSKIGITLFEEALQEDTPANRYKKQREILAEVKEILGRQNERIITGISFKGEIIKAMEPNVTNLDTMIEVGQKDLKAFKEETAAMALQIAPEDYKGKKEIRIREKIALIFDEKLNRLANMAEAYYLEIEEYQISQLTDMTLVGIKTDQIKHGVPLMESQAGLMVVTKEQTQQLTEAKALDDVINNTIMKNADELLVNVNTASELSVNGGLRTSTIEHTANQVSKAIETYRNRQKQIKYKMIKDAQTRERLRAQRNKDKQEILGLFEDNLLADGLTESLSNEKKFGGK